MLVDHCDTRLTEEQVGVDWVGTYTWKLSGQVGKLGWAREGAEMGT